MLHSMTGFGNATAEFPGKRFSLEIRSLNSKQLEINMRLPMPYKSEEIGLRKIISKSLERGKVDVFFNFEVSGAVETNINYPLMNAYASELKAFCEKMDIPQNEILRTVVMLPNVMVTENKLSEEESEVIKKMCREALEKLKKYRFEEGDVLEKDFRKAIELILEKLAKIEVLMPNRVPRIRERLENALVNNGKHLKYDENRFEQELIFYLEKLDINEEVVRLRNNCEVFLKELDLDVTKKGKKLNFIGQEIGREINTIGSKANDQEMQMLVVEMKDELEKIKEQIPNVL